MHTLGNNLKKEFYKHYSLVFVIFAFCMALVASFFATRDMQPSSAASLSNFKAGNIISDAVMGNYNAMSVADIQNFLSSKNKCDNRDYNLYLQYKSAHPTINWHWENGHFVCLAEERFGDGEVIGSGMTAAEIIYDAAQKSHINPQVLLVLLQKESSLITDKVPNDYDYRKATGYGCPDTAACDSKYYGFKNQIYRAAELFRYVLDHNSVYYPAGRTVYVGYHPSSSCGGTQVYIENRATAALYQYTPYQPNSAALNAGYGTGNACSAYGNRNFYLYFSDWFGSTQKVIDDEILASIPEGTYGFATALAPSENYVFDVAGLSKKAGANVQLWRQYGQGAQRWKLSYNATTQDYTITDLNSELNLSTASEVVSTQTNLQLALPSNSCSQRWRVYQPGNNDLVFESVCARGMVITTAAEDAKNGVNLVLSPYLGTKEQLWRTYIGQTLDDGTYKIQTALNLGLVIDTASLNDANGANLQLWEDYYGGFQNWHLVYESANDAYIITSVETGKSLEVTAALTKNGANIQAWREYGTCGHRWKFIPTNDNTSYTIMSTCRAGQVVDVYGSKTDFGTNIQLWQTNNSNNQKWYLKPAANYVDITEGVYTLTSKADENRAADVAGLKKEDGSNVWLWERYSGGAQQWRLTHNALTGDYTFTDTHSGKALAITNKNGWMGNNVIIDTQSNAGNCTTRWNLSRTSGEYYKIVSSCLDGRVMDIAGAQTAMGTQIWLWEAYDQPAQEWKLTSVE